VQRKDSSEVPVLVDREDLKSAHTESVPPRFHPSGPQERTSVAPACQPLPFAHERFYALINLHRSGHLFYALP
jgi:hypothetical protein